MAYQGKMIDATEYSVRYTGILELLISGYYDAFMLQAIDEIRPESKDYVGVSFKMLRHISELLKRDLALVIWRIYFDSDSKANTVRQLNGYLRKNGVETHQRLSLSNKSLEKELDEARNSFLAHNDAKKSNVSIEIADLNTALDEIRLMLNGLCFPEIDSGVFQLTDQMKYKLSFEAKVGFGLLIQGYAGKKE